MTYPLDELLIDYCDPVALDDLMIDLEIIDEFNKQLDEMHVALDNRIILWQDASGAYRMLDIGFCHKDADFQQ